ncbi:ABC transporter permease [Candidatus Dependentiae bacterium]|nr:MAG: ABC transporter permease [Candidatus Dependentiae bacterium]
MNPGRIYALTIRYFILTTHELGRLALLIYYPILDIALFGYMSMWMQQSSPGTINITLLYLTTIVLWSTVLTINTELSLNLRKELESRNLVNLFSTPMQLDEWIIAGVIISFFKALFSIALGTIISKFFFDVNILHAGIGLIPIALSLSISGLALSFFIIGILIFGGLQITTIIWSIPYLVLTFSAPFYSVDVLPQWIQPITKALPTTHAFEALRHLIEHGATPLNTLLTSFMLNGIYLIISICFFIYMFNKSKERGLAQLEQGQ